MGLTGIGFVHMSRGVLRIEGHLQQKGQGQYRAAAPSPLTSLQRTATPVELAHAHTVATSPVRARGDRPLLLSLALVTLTLDPSSLTPPLP